MILDGKKLSNEIIENIKKEIAKIDKKIVFAIIWVGNDEASSIYVNKKIATCESVGIIPKLFHLNDDVLEEELLNLIDKLNSDDDVAGILVQSPIPKHLDINKCFNRISPDKDIDGFSVASSGRLFLGNESFVPCTPKGIMRLLDYYNISLKGKSVCIINRSNIVGKPLLHLLVNRDATVTMCHSKTVNIASHIKNADIVISAVGKPNFITGDMIKIGAVVIDVGISRVDGKVVGDVDFGSVCDKASYITPVPGGVGPVTIAMVLENILCAVREK